MPPRRVARLATAAVTGCVVLLGAPAPASAHGIGAGAESVTDFLTLGFTHMIAGWDHLLFIAGVLIVTGTGRRAATMISLFALGHSVTLIAATLAGWRVNATFVDMVIALSLVAVAVIGLMGRPQRWRWFAAMVLGFGLIHGLGLSTRLQALGLPPDGQLARVVAFNVGVELGQLLAIGVFVLIGRGLPRLPQRLRNPDLAYAALLAAGGAATIVLAVTGSDDPPSTAEVSSMGDCQLRARTETYPQSGVHPMKDFFGPGEKAPDTAFGHVIGDGFVIVHYPPTLPAEQVAQLKAFVEDPASGRVVGSAVDGQAEPIKLVNAYDTAECTTFDLDGARQFTRTWFADPRSKPVE
ncbi:HupE/UreJ family protein [Couchioplanes caeruleus]|uniref:Hydrogenase/urease accessory protein HupE n=2 Tax=Couchioplanes caeruleus TaxID=56438 RepID=A0A1K0FEB0_9ACTN|nr:HupE/UreJ family protein [Couchioplanes caeruleus]OJF11175.1 hypothetical protein BG844_28115 [Couchioplanes caeruleus subsp. caeruleus]ROP30883.1 uncharacterized protein DUF3105 [Couchioplanes caeruleus]